MLSTLVLTLVFVLITNNKDFIFALKNAIPSRVSKNLRFLASLPFHIVSRIRTYANVFKREYLGVCLKKEKEENDVKETTKDTTAEEQIDGATSSNNGKLSSFLRLFFQEILTSKSKIYEMFIIQSNSSAQF